MMYIEPRIKKYETLNNLLESKEASFFFDYFDTNIKADDLLNIKKIFIVSEPGYGKTRLLKEQLLKSDKEGVFIDLKKIGNQNLESCIKNKTFHILKEKKFNEFVDEGKLFKTEKFELRNSDQLIFCLDALDEVKSENFSAVVENIKEFIEIYNQANFLISCRKNYLNKWQYLFSEINFEFVEIFPLNAQKVKEFLVASGIDEKKINDLLEKLQFQNRKFIIQTPRYLKMIAELIQKEGVDKIKNISRIELFEKFIYQKLNIESEKINKTNNQEIIKKVLEKLALIMEIYQSNQISKDQLMEFFDDTKSNLNISFLNQVPIDIFYERSLLKNNIDSVEFENTEFQEYLAAKEILRLGRVEQVVFDLAIVKELEEVHPSWINTLSFVIDFDINLLKTIFEYVFSNRQIVHIEEHIKLLTKYNVEKLNAEDRRNIFKMVYYFYQDNLHWMHDDVAEKLAFYYDDSLYEHIEKYIIKKRIKGKTKEVIVANAMTLIALLLEKKLLTKTQKDHWKKLIKRFLNTEHQNEVVLKRALYALGKYKEIQLFTPRLVDKIFKTDKDTIITNLIYALEEINNLDAPIAVTCFLRGVAINNISARYALYKVDGKYGIKKILDEFISEENLLHKFIEHESIYKNGDEFIKNIRKNADEFIIGKLKTIVFKAFSDHFWYESEKSDFIKNISLLITEYSPDFVFELIEKGADRKTLYSLMNIFAILLKKEDIQNFIEVIKKFDNNATWIAMQTLQLIKYSSRKDREDIYEYGRKYLEKEYQQAEKVKSKFASEDKKRESTIYDDFKLKLEPEKNKYDPSVFQFYIENEKELEQFITIDDKKRLEKLIKDSIFEKFDPGQQKITINRRENGSTNYMTHQWIFIFGSCILVAIKLDIDILSYRQKILNYIPFSYDDHLAAIFHMIPNPTKEELDNVLKIYENRSDDLKIFMPSSTIEFCKKYGAKQGIPILKFFVSSNQLSLYERKNALSAIARLNEAKEYFQVIFDQYKVITDEQQELSSTANEILITQFKSEDAIKWRFKELVNRAFPFQRIEGVHSIGPKEHEITDKEFARPLIQLKDICHKDQFLQLLTDSFEVNSRGDDYYAYTSYLWSIVIDYFKNLKELRSYEVLRDLDNFILRNNKQKGINWFSYQYQQLKFEYLVYIGKPQNISDCIKNYNFYKEKIYLDIATPDDLLAIVRRVINEDLKKWVEAEGAYKFIEIYKPQKSNQFRKEDLIQKTIITQFENGLLKAGSGLRKEEVHIQREAQLLDDKRTDFLISYGFIGPILVEIKLTNNPEITDKKTREQYKKKLIQYIEGTNSRGGIFIIFQTENSNTVEKYLPILQKLYKTEKRVEVVGLNCTMNKNSSI